MLHCLSVFVSYVSLSNVCLCHMFVLLPYLSLSHVCPDLIDVFVSYVSMSNVFFCLMLVLVSQLSLSHMCPMFVLVPCLSFILCVSFFHMCPCTMCPCHMFVFCLMCVLVLYLCVFVSYVSLSHVCFFSHVCPCFICSLSYDFLFSYFTLSIVCHSCMYLSHVYLCLVLIFVTYLSQYG